MGDELSIPNSLKHCDPKVLHGSSLCFWSSLAKVIYNLGLPNLFEFFLWPDLAPLIVTDVALSGPVLEPRGPAGALQHVWSRVVAHGTHAGGTRAIGHSPGVLGGVSDLVLVFSPRLLTLGLGWLKGPELPGHPFTQQYIFLSKCCNSSFFQEEPVLLGTWP